MLGRRFGRDGDRATGEIGSGVLGLQIPWLVFDAGDGGACGVLFPSANCSNIPRFKSDTGSGGDSDVLSNTVALNPCMFVACSSMLGKERGRLNGVATGLFTAKSLVWYSLLVVDLLALYLSMGYWGSQPHGA